MSAAVFVWADLDGIYSDSVGNIRGHTFETTNKQLAHGLAHKMRMQYPFWTFLVARMK